MSDIAVELKNVGEKFTLYSHKVDTLKGRLLKGFSLGKGEANDFWALKDISLTIKKGEVVGIVGENGSGKTTLLKLIAGVLKPDEGQIDINGSVSAILQLGVGFQRDLSGRENIYLNSAMLGISDEAINKCIGEIIAFAELEDFIDMPLKTYSSGMEMRLGFSIAVNVDPDVLLIDEVLIIGDEAFQRKCIQKIDEFKARGKTIIVVSHSMDLMRQLCERTYLMRQGKIIYEGPTDEVVNYYFLCSGRRDGICRIENNAMECVFNNGRFFAVYNKKMLFSDPGLFFILKTSDKNYYSFHAKWKIEILEETRFEAKGHLESLDMHFAFVVKLEDSGAFAFVLEIASETMPLDIEILPTLRLNSAYKKWFCRLDNGCFSADNESGVKTIHSEVIEKNDFWGVEAYGGEFLPDFPGIMFSYAADLGRLIFSSEGENKKVPQIQFRSVADSDEKHSAAGSAGLFSGNQFVQNEQKKIRQEMSINSEKLSFFVNEYSKSINLFYDDKKITSGSGLSVSFLSDARRIDAQSCKWQRVKKNDSSMALTLFFDDSRLICTIEFILGKGALNIKMDFNGSEISFNESFFAALLIKPEYAKWVTDTLEGVSPEIKDQSGWTEIKLPENSEGKFFALENDKEDLPALVFSDLKSGSKGVNFSFHNVLEYETARAVRFDYV